jgi:hypothetical protein
MVQIYAVFVYSGVGAVTAMKEEMRAEEIGGPSFSLPLLLP